ncbi:MAG: rhomboid family intramembrane serine protease [Luteolibacter sp.]
MKNEGQTEEGGEPGLPIWARDDAFPEAGEGFGWIDRKGGRHAAGSQEELEEAIRQDKDSVMDLVWTPDSRFCRVPEEIEAFSKPIMEVRKQWATDDLATAKDRLKWLGLGVLGLVGYMGYQGWSGLSAAERAGGIDLGFFQELVLVAKAVSQSTTVGIALLVFLIFAFIPWYQAQKKKREIFRNDEGSKPVVPLIRFETWLAGQKAPVTWGLLVVISLVGISQLVFKDSIQSAGLVKDAYLGGEKWRLLTAPMLHGHVLHFAMNALGLLYLGKRVEVFARWPHVPMVFVFSAIVGGEATARLMDATSVGASGGLMGWLGFLLVFETLHGKLVPRSAKRRLMGGVVMTALIGLVGYRFIDNAAHFGGLLAGMAYALVVFPKSSSVLRPRIMALDRIVGVLSLGGICFAAFLAISKMAG